MAVVPAPPEKPASPWVKRLGPVGAAGAFLLKFKWVAVLAVTKGKLLLLGLLNLKTLLSIAAFLGVYWALYGWWFALGFVASIALHEMGHYVTVRHYGLQAQSPVFIPGLGAYVQWQGTASVVIRARISLAGPLFGFFAAVSALLLYRVTGQGVWIAVAHTCAWLNLLNLIPVFIFDGASAMTALGRQERFTVIVACLVLWFLFQEAMFLFVAIGAGYRIFKRDFPELPSQSTASYFIGLLIALGLVSWICTLTQL
jgi:Zn-dependent protease